MYVRLFAIVILTLLTAGTAFAQNDRRDRQNPELIVESGGRLGSCDKIQFTSDGKYLLAVGDDKVVRIWPYRDGKLQTEGMRVLRWVIWREQRGAIFALALSPDPENKYVAIAGLGQPTSTVAILERATGKMLYRVVAMPPNGEESDAIWSLDFAPDGKRVAFGDSRGGVWIWDFTHPAERVGKHDGRGSGSNVVRFVHFFKDGTLRSAAEDGTIRRWELSKKPATFVETRFATKSSIFRVALSPDERWYAAATKGPLVVLRAVNDPQKTSKIELKEGEFARALAFDTKSGRLAVGIGGLLKDNPFLMECPDRLDFYDLNGKLLTEGPHGFFRIWFIAFNPNSQDVAIAAGENHEVKLYRLNNMDQPVSDLGGAGKSLWAVGLSTDGNAIRFRDQRNPMSTEPNNRGQGPWRAFHLLRRDWLKPADFKAVEPYQPKGWSVEADKKNQYVWYAVPSGKPRLPLAIDGLRDGMPRCYTFIPPTDKHLLRLAVGHLWGVSIFELTPTSAKRVRLLTGHQADVTAMAVSADGSYLVTASMDQTIAGWNLNKIWDSQPILGASFEIKDDRLFVKKVDVGSPAWEAGLVAGDEVKEFHYAGDPVKLKGGPQSWWDKLKEPVPGIEHGFKILRGGKPLSSSLATTLRQRPLWRFFPTRDNEWVLWMWQNSYYDTSTKGDSYIGWHVNAPDLAHEPAFYRAEQFRKIYERPDVLDKLLLTKDVQAALREALGANPLPPKFNATEPPLAALKLAAATTKNENVEAMLTLTPHGDNPDFQPEHTELWINDFRLDEDKHPEKWGKTGEVFRKTVTIPNAKLRADQNVLTFQVYNRVGGRAEATAVLTCTRPAPPPRLFGLAVGVNDYGAIKVGPGGRGQLGNLKSACNDAQSIQESWLSQKTLYSGTDMFLNLNAKAKRADILAALDQLAKKVGPEDRCVLFLAGHGIFVKHEGTKEQPPRTTWLFCCPDYDATRPEETCITSEVLYAKLAAIAGRKLVILDACHSGEAAANPVRSLVPGGQGPIIIASCDRNQSSYEDDKKLKHGLFSYALLEALGDKFAIAAKGNKELDAEQLFQYTRGRMPKLLKDLDPNANEFAQVPILFKPSEQLFPIAKAK